MDIFTRRVDGGWDRAGEEHRQRQLGGAVDIKYQHAPRRDEQMEPLKTFLHILRMQKIIQTVCCSNRG
mgnify:CR=1 FL=1